jgi:hypothetical protein
MSDTRWIVIRNWDRFQHPDAARSRALPWIKVWTELLSNEDFLSLSPVRRSLLLGLWLEYARTRLRIAQNTRSLSRRLQMRVRQSDLDALNNAGFIEFSASKPARKDASNDASKPASTHASTEEEGELLRSSPKEHASTRALTGAARAHAKEKESVNLLDADLLDDVYPEPARSSTNSPRYEKPRKVAPYAAAEAMTRNVGHMYPFDVFLEELSRFDLSADDKDRLKTLWAELAEQADDDF